MKVISNNELNYILDRMYIDRDDIEYFSSGKCGDLYLYRNRIIKIMKWHQKIVDDDIENKINMKLYCINKLNLCGIRCPRVFKIDDRMCKLFWIHGELIVVYQMELLMQTEQVTNKMLVADFMKKFHKVSQTLQSDTKQTSWEDEHKSVLSVCKSDSVKKVLEELYSELSNLSRSSDVYGLIHYDSNMNNYIMSNNSIYMIDFDSVCYGWYLMDVANYLFSIFNVDIIHGKFMPIEEFKAFVSDFSKRYGLEKNNMHLRIFLKYRLAFIYGILFCFIKDIDRKNIEDLLFGGEIMQV